MALEQQPYNLFAQQKMAGYPSATTPDTSARVAGQATVTPTQPIAQEPPVTNTTAQTQKVTPVQPQITSMEDLVNAMYTSPQEEERMRRASVANQRILAVGDALRHIGNIANTINYAPAQKLNSPVLEEEARYKQGKALRDKANLTYMNYQQAKAAQDAKAAQLNAEINYKQDLLQHYKDQDRRLWAKQGNDADYRALLLGLRAQKQQLDDDYRKGKLSIDRYNAESRRISAKAAQLRASNGGGGGGRGGKYWAYDEDGNIHYYPNKSMYEQGVYEFGIGQDTNEEYNKGTDVFGKPQKGVRKRSVTSMGGERARQARNKGGKKQNPMGGSSNGKKKNPMS